ncbi:MAG: hypothetical protein JW759_02370 [Candidatus Coatesbacteria bacterium]|nr:hypothetical protein [Candidatus Coatesbacteria bacterium]
MQVKQVVAIALTLAVSVPMLSFFCLGADWAEFSNTHRVSALGITHIFGGEDLLAATNGGLVHWRSGEDPTVIGMLEGLPSKNVTAICDSPEFGLLIGTDRGVLHVSKSGLRYLDSLNGLAHDSVFDVAFDGSGRLLVATLAGLCIIDGPVVQILDSSDGLPADRMLSVYPDRDGGIWVGTGGFGAAKLIGDRVLRLTTQDGLASDFVSDIDQSQTGRVIFATDGGVSVFDAGQVTSFGPTDHIFSPAFSCLEATWDGALCGGPSGLYELDGGVFRRVQHGVWEITESVQAMTTDSEGVTVVALEPDGPNDSSFILRLEGESGIEKHETPPCPLNGSVSSLLKSGGLVFVGLAGFGGGLSIFDGASWQSFDYRNSPLAFDGVSAFLFEGEALWVGTLFDGLWRQSESGLRHLTHGDTLASNLISSLCAVDGGLWVGHCPIWDGYWHRGGGASFYDGIGWSAFSYGTPLEGRFVNAICEADDGAVVFGTGYPLAAGAAIIKRGSAWEVVSQVAGIALSNVLCGTTDAYGRVLLGTERSGIAAWDGNAWFLITAADGLFTNAVLSMAAASNGLVIVSCDDVLDPAFVQGGICLLVGREVWQPPADSVPIDAAVTAIWADEVAGEWWFGTRTGSVFRYSHE